MSLFGAGFIKVTKKETVGGRTGFACELYTKQDDKEQLTWASSGASPSKAARRSTGWTWSATRRTNAPHSFSGAEGPFHGLNSRTSRTSASPGTAAGTIF